MAEINLIKITNGFTIVETNESCTFKTSEFMDNPEALYHIVSSSQGIFFTDKGAIILTTDCSVDGVTYPNIEEFITALYAV
jgi:hypothetical protein